MKLKTDLDRYITRKNACLEDDLPDELKERRVVVMEGRHEEDRYGIEGEGLKSDGVFQT